MKRPTHRGQTLVVFSLLLLLLTLMVCMTLSIGMRAREKMELETAADAAAYSQAVATARAFNSIALMNRALVSHMVAMAGVESLISWSGYYRASLHAAKKAYETPKLGYAAIAAASCPCAANSSSCMRRCKCSLQAIRDINETQEQLMDADDEAETTFRAADPEAGVEARSLQLSSIHEDQLEVFNGLQVALGLGPGSAGGGYSPIAPNITRELGEEVSVLEAPNTVNARELGGSCPEGRTGPGAACERRKASMKDHFIWAAMGSRGHGFVTGRAGGANPLRAKIIQSMPSDELVRVTDEGSSYFAPSQPLTPTHAAKADGGAAYGDDHGPVTVIFRRAKSPCPTFPPSTAEAKAHVRSDDTSLNTDQHQWTGGRDPVSRLRKHTLGDCTQCPGMWPPHMDYNPDRVALADDLFGQPKNYVVLQRDYAQRAPDPWNLLFRFRFNPSRAGTVFDNTGLHLTDGTDISKAVALSAGMAYYHRVGEAERWQEPPNLLNPFWRATLVGADVDQPKAVPDISSTLSAAGSQAQQLADALAQQGYQAW
jgi:hypothetical protein